MLGYAISGQYKVDESKLKLAHGFNNKSRHDSQFRNLEKITFDLRFLEYNRSKNPI